MARRSLWGLLVVVTALGIAGCGTKETPVPATVSGQPAGAEKMGGEKNAGGEAMTEASASQGAGDGDKTCTIRIAIVPSDSHLHNTVPNEWAQETKEETNGWLILKVMGSSQLGGERDYVEGMQLGNIEMAQISSAAVNGLLSDFSLLSFPYFFEDYAEMEKVFSGPMGDELFTEPEGIGIKGLTWFSNGFRSVYTKNTSVTAPADMKGLKIRVMESNAMIATLNAMNASGASMAYSELYSAIQQGVMGGVENALGNIYSDGYYEIYKDMSLTERFVPPGVVAISQKSYDFLPDDLEEYLTESAVRSGKMEREMDEKLQEEMKKKLEERGVQINEVDKQSFIDVTASVYTEHADGTSDTVKVLAEEELGKSFN